MTLFYLRRAIIVPLWINPESDLRHQEHGIRGCAAQLNLIDLNR
jgi:hypothetical protein